MYRGPVYKQKNFTRKLEETSFRERRVTEMVCSLDLARIVRASCTDLETEHLDEPLPSVVEILSRFEW